MPFRPIAKRQIIIIFSILFKKGDLLVVACKKKEGEQSPSPILGSAWCDTVC